MKNTTTISFLFSFLFLILTQISISQTFVNHNATGSNDGTSWADAFTDLSDALTNTTSGEIWVAQGTYTPTTTSNGSFSFIITNDITLYGGFIGNETAASQRDFSTNTTILSGDINGDDVEGDFETNRSDNAAHVVYVDSLIGTLLPIVIDGFDIISGHTGDDPDLPEISWRGGGIFSYSSIEVFNCNFLQNFGRGGAGVYLSPETGGGSQSRFKNCVFRNNRSTAQAAGLFINSINGVTIEESDFSFNETTRGAFYPLRCSNILVVDCSFNNNVAIDNTGFGGALFSWNNTNLEFLGCEFSENSAGNGGVMYMDGRESTDVDVIGVIFNTCTFSGNRALDFGGGTIYSWMASYSIENSTFGSNFGDNGSHIFNGGDDKRINYSNTEFIGGSAIFGGAVNCYGANGIYDIRNCSFTGNQAATSGGAIILGFGAELDLTECEFIQNMAGFGGGVSVQNDLTNLNISSCTFQNNTATGNGGGVRMTNSGTLNIDGCNFFENAADFGGGLHVTEAIDSIGNIKLNLTNSVFNANTADTQGAGINLVNVDGTITNVVCNNNFNVSGVAGGGMSVNVSDNLEKTVSIINSTIVNNFAPIGGGIATFTDSTDSKLTLNIQNTILFNTGSKDYEVEEGTPTINSLGGNLSGDLTTTDIFTDISDQSNVEDMYFVNGQSDYHLTAQSPAINVGVATGAPLLDLEGNSRVDGVDAGAYEFQGMINTTDIDLAVAYALKAYPNPASQWLNISFENEWTGTFTVSIFSIDGKEIAKWQKEKRQSNFEDIIDVSTLQANTYEMLIDNGREVMARQFIKME